MLRARPRSPSPELIRPVSPGTVARHEREDRIRHERSKKSAPPSRDDVLAMREFFTPKAKHRATHSRHGHHEEPTQKPSELRKKESLENLKERLKRRSSQSHDMDKPKFDEDPPIARHRSSDAAPSSSLHSEEAGQKLVAGYPWNRPRSAITDPSPHMGAPIVSVSRSAEEPFAEAGHGLPRSRSSGAPTRLAQRRRSEASLQVPVALRPRSSSVVSGESDPGMRRMRKLVTYHHIDNKTMEALRVQHKRGQHSPSTESLSVTEESESEVTAEGAPATSLDAATDSIKATKIERPQPKRSPAQLKNLFKAKAKQVVQSQRVVSDIHGILTEKKMEAERARQTAMSKGSVYTWGRGIEGQLGHGERRNNEQANCIDKLRNREITSVECGGVHTACLTDQGQLYTWGRGNYGQLGHGSKDNLSSPQLVDYFLNSNIIQVSLGYHHSACVTDDGKIFTWGHGADFRLGHGNEKDCYLPKQVATLKDHLISQVGCGEEHTVALTDNGDIFSWGRGEEGQLGCLGCTVCQVPRHIQGHLFRIQQIAVGSFHTLALNFTGEVFSWGWGNYGQLGHGNEQDMREPKIINALQGKQITQISAGGYHSAAITSTGQLYVWGFYGMDSKRQKIIHDSPQPVNELKQHVFVHVSCGDKSCGAVTEKGDVYWIKFRMDDGRTETWQHESSLGQQFVVSIACGWKHRACVVAGHQPPKQHRRASFKHANSDESGDDSDDARMNYSGIVDASLKSIEKDAGT